MNNNNNNDNNNNNNKSKVNTITTTTTNNQSMGFDIIEMALVGIIFKLTFELTKSLLIMFYLGEN